jgi:hypothetical protein
LMRWSLIACARTRSLNSVRRTSSCMIRNSKLQYVCSRMEPIAASNSGNETPSYTDIKTDTHGTEVSVGDASGASIVNFDLFLSIRACVRDRSLRVELRR